MNQYQIIQADTIQRLEYFVAEKLHDGWQPLGGPMASGTFTNTFYQAMIKEPKQENKPGPTEVKSKWKV